MHFNRILTVCFLLFSLHASSQSSANISSSGEITGTILDSVSKLPIEYSTISLFEEGNEKPLGGSITNTQGKFKLEVSKPGYFNILVESIGYISYTTHHLLIDKNSFKNLGKILLVKKVTSLQAVTITSSQKLIENKMDKMVFNAEKDLSSQGGVVTDILKKIPQVSVDVDGNVELAGSTSIRFLIDGKPSTAFGSNIADVLQSIPASQIKSIEVITNPGAKYDAEGLGGIINIILKHNSAKGINGSVSLTAASRNENGSFNLSVRNGNLGVNAFVNGNVRIPATTPLTSTRISQDTSLNEQVILNQDGSSRFYRYGAQSGLSIDYTLQKKNNFTFSVNDNLFGNSNNALQDQNQTSFDNQGASLGTIFSSSKTQSGFSLHSINLSLDYKRTFDKEDRELDIGIHSSTDHNNFNSVNTQFNQPVDTAYYGTNNTNPGTEAETEIVLDYTEPISKKVTLGVGGKMVFTDIHSVSNVLSLQPGTGEYIYDSTLSNYLRYRQQVYALYSELNFPVSNWFDAKVGLRYERTELNPFFSDIPQQVAEPGYNTWVPSVFLIRKLNDNQSLKLSYSKRIERPDYRELNPFINTTDPYNITTGNPYLQPEIGHRFELGWNYDLNSGGSFMISAFYRLNQNDIQPYVVYYASLPVGDTVYKNVAVSTSQNIGTEKNLGVNLFSDLHLNTKFNIRTNIFLFYRQGINTLDSNLKVESFNYRINMNLSYNFSSTLAGEFFANFNSPRNEIQGKYPSFSSYTLAFRKQIWKKKGSIALTGTNIFSEYLNQTTELFGPNFTVNSTRKIPFRSIGINFTWKFGKLEFKKPKPENTDLAAPVE
ncbi:MAG TPA: TonB-dependent receptor [Puia sp.]|nr:TonB-dependent receptor [Puia sp.]